MQIPYSIETRPDTGLTNGRLGMWLFLASEVMLFGGLFSSYVILRTGAASWSTGFLNVPAAAVNTGVLLLSSWAVARAARAAREHDDARSRRFLLITIGLGVLFLAIKGFEYSEHIARGEYPRVNNALAMYYTLTGFHALHIIGGLLVLLYFVGPGARLQRSVPGLFANRVENGALYWHFVDVVWLTLFISLYLV